MTTVVPSSSCPLPPPDLHSRKIPTIELDVANTSLYRIHQTRYSARFFTRRGLNNQVYRFDDPIGEYGVLYASPSFEACVAETIFRSRFQTGPLLIETDELTGRSISRIGVADRSKLTLANLTVPLFPIGGSNEISSAGDYAATNAWSRAFYEHPSKYDGLYYPSRYSNLPSIALFDRVDAMILGTIPLTSDVRLAELLDKYQIALVPRL
jgi:hypothetical protein